MSQSYGASARQPQMIVRQLDKPEETRTFQKGRMDLVTLGGVTFGRAVFQPGWRWSTCVKPVAQTGSCQVSHLVYQVSGRIRIRMDDGTEHEIGPGDVASIPPGHDAWVVGDEPAVAVDIAGAADYAKPKR